MISDREPNLWTEVFPFGFATTIFVRIAGVPAPKQAVKPRSRAFVRESSLWSRISRTWRQLDRTIRQPPPSTFLQVAVQADHRSADLPAGSKPSARKPEILASALSGSCHPIPTVARNAVRKAVAAPGLVATLPAILPHPPDSFARPASSRRGPGTSFADSSASPMPIPWFTAPRFWGPPWDRTNGLLPAANIRLAIDRPPHRVGISRKIPYGRAWRGRSAVHVDHPRSLRR